MDVCSDGQGAGAGAADRHYFYLPRPAMDGFPLRARTLRIEKLISYLHGERERQTIPFQLPTDPGCQNSFLRFVFSVCVYAPRGKES